MSDQYRTVVGIAAGSHVVKRSRFFGAATAVSTQAAVKDFLKQVQAERPGASHYCYAYKIGRGEGLREYATDAGEPRRSAGPPILSAIRAYDVSNVVCVVVRYYGGVNLGIGGLIRAYGRCARECFENAKLADRVFYEKVSLKVAYRDIGSVVNMCRRFGGKVIDITYQPGPVVRVQIRQGVLQQFQLHLQGLGIVK